MKAPSRRRAPRRAVAGQAVLVASLLSSALPTHLDVHAAPGFGRTLAATPATGQLEASAISEAVRIGRSPEAERSQFHAAYHVAVDDPVIRGIDVVTGFRRLVQLTEERERLRDASWDAARASVAARDFTGLVDLVLSLQFNPANTFRVVPAYTMAVYPRTGGVVRPIDLRSAPSYVNAQPAPPGTPILSATVTATFDATRLDLSSPCIVGIFLDGREVRRVEVDLRSMR